MLAVGEGAVVTTGAIAWNSVAELRLDGRRQLAYQRRTFLARDLHVLNVSGEGPAPLTFKCPVAISGFSHGQEFALRWLRVSCELGASRLRT